MDLQRVQRAILKEAKELVAIALQYSDYVTAYCDSDGKDEPCTPCTKMTRTNREV